MADLVDALWKVAWRLCVVGNKAEGVRHGVGCLLCLAGGIGLTELPQPGDSAGRCMRGRWVDH
eukprot:1358189-Amphidinium_carterae.2